MAHHKQYGARYKARRRAVDILFEAETRDLDPVGVVEERAELSANPANEVAPVAEYTRVIVGGVAEKLDDIDDAIERFLSADWALDRLPAVDRQILRVGAWEILFNNDIDAPVAISNALAMAEEYAGSAAPPYIHAVLDDIVHAADPAAPAIEETGDVPGEELE
ncbi:transcription antitermination factor NusB [Corynebacterium liangguodongii]|uniref:Transcription antitermination protein NusB n=1 Tax=Corynebacterium liangguodongii TaxID=2079535 RepID=A0A2S0WED7_9CORY|nr:transcription antitermination factor NusB [Corynebacterium liangguodongii]AWB84094.1 transcription antitermination factor NusB [Corynebacterium liangguodongii]PWC00105.1 transcription antitermination factor NusB [Corynebacterium liangguodongii]